MVKQFLFVFLLAFAAPAAAQRYDVRAHGAVGDGHALDSPAVQAAIDACAAAGGGTVTFPAGTYVCGTVRLKSHVGLYLEHGATILGSKRRGDYDPFEALEFENDADWETALFHHALIRGEDVEQVAIEGGGTIDSNFTKRKGPKSISLKRCRMVRIRDVKILNAPNYAISMLGTDDVVIDGVSIINGYCDGIDPDSCRRVRISNCFVDTIDDAIVPKASFSLGERRASEDITVTNCVLSTVCNGFKLGTESGGGFRRITVSNCVITGHKDGRPAISGIALESVDGAVLEDVVVSNVTMRNVRAPIFVRLGNRGRDMETAVPGELRRVSISNITAGNASLACSITGIPGHPVRGVTLDNIRIHYTGGSPHHPADAPVPEVEADYPEALMFGGLPAYGLYCRHVEDLVLANVHFDYADDFWRLTTHAFNAITWPRDGGMPSPAEPGVTGHALFCEDVRGLRIDGFSARPSSDGATRIRFVDVKDAYMTDETREHVMQGEDAKTVGDEPS